MLDEYEIVDQLERETGVKVYMTEVPDDTELDKSVGYIKPYIILTIGGGSLSARDAGITGYKNDIRLGNCIVQCVAITANDVRNLARLVDATLTDWVGTGTGAFKPTGNLGSDNGNSSTKPTKFFRYLGFSFPYNL